MWMEQICLLPNTVADGFLILIRHSFFFPVKNQIANLLQALQQKHHNLPYLILLQNRSCLTWKKFTWKICFTTLAYFEIAQHHYNHYKSFPSDISCISEFRAAKIFVIARAFDIMQFLTCYKKFLIAVIVIVRHYQWELSKLLPIGDLPVQIQP